MNNVIIIYQDCSFRKGYRVRFGYTSHVLESWEGRLEIFWSSYLGLQEHGTFCESERGHLFDCGTVSGPGEMFFSHSSIPQSPFLLTPWIMLTECAVSWGDFARRVWLVLVLWLFLVKSNFSKFHISILNIFCFQRYVFSFFFFFNNTFRLD